MAAVNKVREELAQAFLAALTDRDVAPVAGLLGAGASLQRRYRQTL